MKEIANLEAKRAYDKIRGEKDKFGSYRKTLFHVHTPESHDYRLFKKWEKLSESEWNGLTINDYMEEVKKREIFPGEFFQTSKGDSILYENYSDDGFKNGKEKISFLTVAQSLYNENISVVVVSDHNTTLGIKKIKKAIKLVSNLPQNKDKEYIEVINGVEISCADRVHVLIAFPDSKFEFIQGWLGDNLMSVKEGSFKSSLEVLDTFIREDCLAYIAHINSSDVFKNKHFSIAYKKRLFSAAYTKIIGVSNPEKITSVNSYFTDFFKKSTILFFVLDNDSHYIENHSINSMWIKFSKRTYEQLREALSEYDISVELKNPENNKTKTIRGIYIPALENSYLQMENLDFVIKFSDSLNCLIGGRGTGKSTILDLIQLVLSQKADTKQKFEFLSIHSRVYILYEMLSKEYIVELNLPTQKKGEDIYEVYGVKTKATSKYWYYENRLKEKIKDKYLSIYEVQKKSNLIKLNKTQKYKIIYQMFDNRYSVNQLVNIASDDRISDYLFEVISKDNNIKKYQTSSQISSIDEILSFMSNEEKRLEKQKNDILSCISLFNDTQSEKLKISYTQQKEFILPENFYTWFFIDGKNLDNSFKGYRLTNGEVIEYFAMIFERNDFKTFVNLLNNRNLEGENSIKKFAKDSSLSYDVDLKEVDDTLLNEIFKLWNDLDISLVQKYLEDVYNGCEKLSLEFNINSKVTDGNEKVIFKEVMNLSLGQKVVAMLDFILAYSEFTNDNRPLLIDQPEDNLDSRYIYNNLVQVLRDVKDKRQIIIATHNATIVTNAMSDLVILMESDGEHGWVKKCGYPGEDTIKKHIVNYLEGGQESFEHKVKIYKRVIDTNKI